MAARVGTYVLAVRLATDQLLPVGALGSRLFRAGQYLYCGSAFGPGGLRSRLGRHYRSQKRLRWHIDYLLLYAIVDYACVIPGRTLSECQAARALRHFGCAVIAGFGSSDCRCPGHLLVTEEPVDPARLEAILRVRGIDAPATETWNLSSF